MGFPQPYENAPPLRRVKPNGRAIVPMGSIWEMGFRVKRPWDLAVGSPRRSAASAWANS